MILVTAPCQLAGMADLAARPRRPGAEGDELDALVADLAAAGWATPDAGAGLDVAHQIAHLAWTDEAAAARRHRPGGVRDAVVLEAVGRPDGFVDEAAAERRRSAAAPSCSAAGATGARPLAEALRARARRARRCPGSGRR